MGFYNGEYTSSLKNDDTPVTDADIAASDIIVSSICENYPEAAVLCEETAEDLDSDGQPVRLSSRRVFIVDPLDGTKAFLNKSGQFAVSISYVEDHVGTAAVILAPALGVTYYAAKGFGAWKTLESSGHDPFSGERISVSDRTDNLVLLVSNTNDDVADLTSRGADMSKISRTVSLSSCLKGCMIAEGKADVHYKFASYTKEWDTSAEEIICREAGGVVTDAFGGELISNRRDHVNRRGIRLLNSRRSDLITSSD